MSVAEQIVLPDLAAMQTFGARISKNLRAGDVIALEGELSAGKTTLARAILAALGYEGEVPSPSFNIIETYDAPPLRVPVAHADFYRLEDIAEIEEIGLSYYREGAVLIAEWPSLAGGFAHEPQCLSIQLELPANKTAQGRIAIVKPGADWLERWP